MESSTRYDECYYLALIIQILFLFCYNFEVGGQDGKYLTHTQIRKNHFKLIYF